MSAALPFDDSTHAQPWPVQRGLLIVAASKAEPRRFSGASITGFGGLDEEVELRPIDGFTGYFITSDGRVWSEARPGRPVAGFLRTQLDRNGYRRAWLFDGRRARGVRVARAVLQAFVGPAPSQVHQANHIDGDKENDRVANLEWVTPVENTHHAIRAGLVTGRSPRLVEHDGRLVPVGSLPRHPSLSAEMVAARVFGHGWDLAAAVTTPALPRGYNGDGSPKRPSGREKLTPELVATIAKDTRALQVVAAEYGVTPECISQLRRGVTWSSITGFGELPVEFQAEVEPELRPEFAQAIRLIRAGRLEPRHCDIQALLGLLCTLAADAAKAGHQGYEDVSEHLDAAHGALDNCYGASA